MPLVVENIKNYFETLNLHAVEHKFHDSIKKDNIKDTEINGLFTDHQMTEALKHVNKEFEFIQSLSRNSLKKNIQQHMRTLELIIFIFQLNGEFRSELTAIKLYRNLATMICDIEERNYAYAIECFWHLIQDTKTCLPEKSIAICRRIIINKHVVEKTKKVYLVNLAKTMFESSQPNFVDLFARINELKSTYQNFFSRSSVDSYITRNMSAHYEQVLRTKALSMGLTTENFNLFENGLTMRRISLRSIEYLKSKYSDLTLNSGSYETLIYLWTFVSHLLTGMQMIAELYTLMGVEKEAKQCQYEFFLFSVKYCVPFRTKIALRLMMHSDFIYLRLPELSIRNTQLDKLKNCTEEINLSLHTGCEKRILEDANDEYDIALTALEDDFFISKSNKSKKPKKLNALYLAPNTENEKEITFDNCYIAKSSFKVDLTAIYDVIKTYIWQIDNGKKNEFSFNNDWENNFIEPLNEEDSLSLEIQNLSFSTPPSSPKKASSPERQMLFNQLKAPARVRRHEQAKAKIIKKSSSIREKEADDSDGNPIETFNTVFIPNKPRNIKYEEPELPRSVQPRSSPITDNDLRLFESRLDHFKKFQFQDSSESIFSVENNAPSLIQYLEDHAKKYQFLNIPVIHRPIYQRLGLHYLSLDHKKAAYYLSLSINIGFRQLYSTDIQGKVSTKTESISKHALRWEKTLKTMNDSMKTDSTLHASLEELMPANWTVLQFCMIDEIPISKIKSSLLNNVDGGCLGARNCATLLVTKYQNRMVDCKKEMTIETRVLHGFRKTGLQLLDQLEEIKAESANGLAITDRKSWWKKRFAVDTQIKVLTDQMRTDWFANDDLKWLMDENTEIESEPKILITDRNLSRLPMESMLIRNNNIAKCITRMPNVPCLVGHLYQNRYRHVADPKNSISRSNLDIDPKNTFFLVNPDNTLQETEDAVLPLFKTKMNWEGLTGKSKAALDAPLVFSEKDMIIFCGHGTGGRYFLERSLKSVTSSASLFLIGCQSARFLVEGRSEAYGYFMNYLTIGCPSIFGLLWDVTDREIDKFTLKMFTSWLSKKSTFSVNSDTYAPVAPMPSYVCNKEIVDIVQLKNLTGSSAVVYGLPVWINDASEIEGLD